MQIPPMNKQQWGGTGWFEIKKEKECLNPKEISCYLVLRAGWLQQVQTLQCHKHQRTINRLSEVIDHTENHGADCDAPSFHFTPVGFQVLWDTIYR